MFDFHTKGCLFRETKKAFVSVRDKGFVTSAVPLLFRLPGAYLHGIGCHRHSLLPKGFGMLLKGDMSAAMLLPRTKRQLSESRGRWTPVLFNASNIIVYRDRNFCQIADLRIYHLWDRKQGASVFGAHLPALPL